MKTVNMMLKGPLREQDDVIDVDDYIFKGPEDIDHFALEDVASRHQALRLASVRISTPRKDYAA